MNNNQLRRIPRSTNGYKNTELKQAVEYRRIARNSNPTKNNTKKLKENIIREVGKRVQAINVKTAVKLYQGANYTKFRNVAYNRMAPTNRNYNVYKKSWNVIMNFLNQSKRGASVPLYRGMRRGLNGEYMDLSFTSWSPRLSTAKGFAGNNKNSVILRLDPANSKNIKMFRPVNLNLYNGETEFILPPGTFALCCKYMNKNAGTVPIYKVTTYTEGNRLGNSHPIAKPTIRNRLFRR